MTPPPLAPHAPEYGQVALDDGLRALHQEVLHEGLPPALREAAEHAQTLQQQAARGRHWAGLAAGVVLAFGVGWLAHARLAGQAGATLAQGAVEREFVHQASLAYAVYQPEKRHPVEVAASEQEHLVQWLSKRLGKPLKIPHLEAQGFSLVGGRLLPGDSGARAQFMFQNVEGQRITLYLGGLEKALSPALQATQFRFEPAGPVPSFYWAEQGFGYALSGPVERATLMALADNVYRQISRD
jgi:anti-sigma factor RsiW